MGKPVEKHPCWTCGFLKVSSSGGSMKCEHPDITQSESYKYGKPFTCRCTPKWCPKDPDKSYLGEGVRIPPGQRQRERKIQDRETYIPKLDDPEPVHAETTQDNAILAKPIELDRVKVEMERVKNEIDQENEMNTADVKMDEVIAKLKDASEARRRLGRIIFDTDFRNTSTSVIERSEEIANTEEELSAKLMDTLDVYDGIQ